MIESSNYKIENSQVTKVGHVKRLRLRVHTSEFSPKTENATRHCGNHHLFSMEFFLRICHPGNHHLHSMESLPRIHQSDTIFNER